VAGALLHYIVENHAHLIPQTFVVQFIAFLQDHLEDLFERWNDLRVARELSDGIVTHHLNEVPERLDGLRNHIRPEVFGMLDNPDQVFTDSQLGNTDGHRSVKGNSRYCLNYRDDSIEGNRLDTLLGDKCG